MDVVFHLAAEAELEHLPAKERAAMLNAVEKLRAIGPRLDYPHTSHVDGAVRELRPRQGRSPWRGFYAQVGQILWVLAVGPEAEQDSRGFRRATEDAERRRQEVLGQA